MAEVLVLDPVEVSVRRTSFSIAPYVGESGPDWGDAAVEQYLADVQQGQLPVDYRRPNRTITIPLLLRDDPTYTFEQLRTRFQLKTGLFQSEGGWLKRQTARGAWFAEIMGATLKLGGSTAQALWGIDADAVMTLTTLPDWYGDEVITATQSNPSDATELIYTLDKPVGGEVGARARLILKNLSTIDMHGLIWGVRSRNYSTDPTARLAYQAEELTPIAPAVASANANASGGTEVKIAGTSANWTAVLSTDIQGVGSFNHAGSYRLWARVRSGANGRAHKVRAVWDVGDMLLPVENPAVRMPLDTDFWLADLGEVRLDPAPIGIHRWQCVIQAADGFGDFAVDKIWLQPLDEAAGRLSIPPSASVGLTGYSARDEFDQSGGAAITTQALPIGGAWTFSHGDTDDFIVDGTNHRLQRNSASDTAARFLYASTPTLTATAAQIDFYLPSPTGGGIQQAYLMYRRVDTNNYGYVSVGNYADGNKLNFGSVVGGAAGPVTSVLIPWHKDNWWSLRVAVTPTGYIFAWLFPQGAVPPADPTLMRYDPTRFATGQALASGKIGIGDQNSGTGADVRYYDNFLAWIPDIDAVAFAGKSAELRYDGMFREAPGGLNYATVSTVIGDLLRLPPAGLEARTMEIFLKPSFGDLDQGSDPALFRLEAQTRFRPSYLFVPEG